MSVVCFYCCWTLIRILFFLYLTVKQPLCCLSSAASCSLASPELLSVSWIQRWSCRRRTWRARGCRCPGWRPASWFLGEPCLTCRNTKRSAAATAARASPPESVWCCLSPTSCASSSGEEHMADVKLVRMCPDYLQCIYIKKKKSEIRKWGQNISTVLHW